MVDEESHDVLSVPYFSLVVYQDSEIEAVYPHDDGERVWTVHDGLDRLSAEAETLTEN